MKNLTTLSLITIAILGLNGCGEDATKSTNNEVNETKEIASNLIEESASNNIENKAKLETTVSASIETSMDILTENQMNEEDAKEQSIASVASALSDLKLDELLSHVTIECGEEQSCIDEAYTSLSTPLTLEKEEAYALAQEFRGETKGLVNDKLVQSFSCEANEVRTVQHYGIEDLFNTNNGAETANPSSSILNTAWISNYPYPVTGYDETSNDRIFADSISNLPSNITKGMFYIGFKSNGSSLQANDTFKIGDYANANKFNTRLDSFDSTWTNVQVNNSNPTTDIYYNDFSNIHLTTGNLLTLANSNNGFDVVVEDDTAVDFITVATCSEPEPVQEIEAVLNKFECNEKEGKLFQVRGGTVDAFDPSSDQVTVVSSNFLGRANPYAITEYDATSYDRHILDTLALPTGTITKAEFSIGYKALNSSLVANDTVYIGKYGSEHAGGRYILHPSTSTPNATEPLWLASSISNGETVRTVNLANISTSTGTNMLNWIQGKSEFEVRVEDDTSVDFTQLNLCVVEKE
ncbi:MAG: Chitinase [uncultured Sulfurovum sp.]|uniref:Chitinase n=1 Tax=uncultured Sulfurovum sp. TaxID=269237 RepID=A0A6S6TRE6_9BACT|nr:MAG: Chitinase [uncultured Sulfurovum sp.]